MKHLEKVCPFKCGNLHGIHSSTFCGVIPPIARSKDSLQDDDQDVPGSYVNVCYLGYNLLAKGAYMIYKYVI